MEEEFDFDPDQSYKDIINDDELNAELIALGWEAEPTLPKEKKPKNTPQSSQFHAAAAEELVDVHSFGDIDDANIQLTAEDLEDPDLLSQFEELSGKPSILPPKEVPAISSRPVQAPVKPQKNPPASASVPTSMNMSAAAPPPTTANEAKSLALKYKREGNDAEALKWFKLAKQLDASVLQAPKPTTSSRSAPAVVKASTAPAPIAAAPVAHRPSSTVSLPAAPVSAAASGDAFSPLEEAINEAMAITGREAKALEATDKKAAVIKFREYKAYAQELAVLKSRRQAGAQPALFRWQSVKTSKTVENLELAEDQIRVSLEGANDLENVLDGHSSRNISVSYTLNIGAKDDGAAAPMTVTGQAKYDNGRVDWNHTMTFPVVKRGRHVQQVYSRKKAVFELTLHRGFFKSPLMLCQAVLPLNDLLTKSEVGGVVPLIAVGDKDGVASVTSTARRGKAVGGSLRVTIRIRSPLLTPEVVVTETRTLIIDPWPSSTSASPAPTSSASSAAPPSVPEKTAPAAAPAADADPQSNPKFASIPEKEKTDPHSPDAIESNDVLEYEIRYTEDLLKSGTVEEDDVFPHQLRLQMLQAKMQILVYNVQNDLITMEDYLEKLKARIAADQVLAVYFKTLGEKEDVANALRIMKRINIMKEELKNAESAQEDA